MSDSPEQALDIRAPRSWPRPRKRWGQNFLTDPNLIRKIIATIQPGPDDHFLEIG
ncbi:MAG: rRNA adenine N-6-methyltransferase family protein, partial [Candidatus Neomarinimicrobiota bacterium]